MPLGVGRGFPGLSGVEGSPAMIAGLKARATSDPRYIERPVPW
jgi:hypothetical protein